MQLMDTLERRLQQEESYFRAQLLREDIARLRRLEALVHSAGDFEAFKRAGSRIGWTAGDLRTGEIREPLEALLAAFYARQTGAPGGTDAALQTAWEALHQARMERLLGCLSTPVPRPDGAP